MSMADDMNKKPGLMNTLEQLEQLGKELSESLKSRSLEEQRLRGKATTLQTIQNALDTGYPEDRLKKYFPQVRSFDNLRQQIKTQQERIRLHSTRSIQMVGSQFSRQVESQFGKTEQNRLISRQQNSIGINNISSPFRDFKFSELEDVATSGRSEIESIGRQAGRIARNNVFSGRTISDPNQSGSSEGYKQIGEQLSRRNEMINYVAAAESEMQRRKLQNLDPKSIEAEKFQYLDKAKKLQLENTIKTTGQFKTSDIESGKDIFIDVKDSTKRLSDLFKELITTTEKLSSTTEKLDDKQREELKNKEQLITQGIKDAEFATKIGKGMNDDGGRRGNWMSGLNALAGGFGAIGSAAQNILVNQRMQQTSNVAGFAGLANQQYDMYQKARSGDVASQLALTQWGEAGQFGTEMRRGTNIALGLHAAGAAAQVGAGAIQVAEGGVQKFNPMSHLLGTGAQNTQEVIGGALNVTQGIAAGATVASDMARGASARGAELSGIQANMQARMAVNAIPAKQMQGLRDFYIGLDVVGQGMGRNASQFIGTATSADNLNKMSDARLSPEQFTQMAQVGVEQMGSTFNTDQIFGARNLERQGFGNMQSNMMRMSQLAQAGANNPQSSMDSVLSNAVRAGLDSSKAIDSMVQHTAAMVAASSVSTAAGIDNVSAASSLLSNTIDPSIKNKEFALERAAIAQEVAKNVTTDTSVSFTGMVNTSRISKTTGLSGTDALFAAKLTTADIKSLQGMNQKEAQESLLKKGVDVSYAKGGVSGFLQNMLTNQTEQMFTGSGALAFGDNKMRDSLVQAALGGKSYNKLSKEEKKTLGQIGITSGLTGEEYYNTSAGINKPVNQGGESLSTKKIADDPKDLKNQMDQLRTSGFKQLSESAIAVSKDLEKFGGALKVFSELQKQFEKGGTNTEKQFSTAGGDFAKDFKTSIGKFDKATDDYSKASAAMMRAAGLLSNGLPLVPNALTNGANQSKDQRAGSVRGSN